MTDAISWRSPRVLRVLALVFIAGALSGAVTYRLTRIFMRPPSPPSGSTLMGAKDTLGMLKRELNLTPAQSEQVAAIIEDYKHYYVNIEEQFEEVRATGKNRIVKILDEQQRSKFEKLSEALK